MKLSTFFLSAASALALLAPAAGASSPKAAPHRSASTHHELLTPAKKTSTDVIYTAPFGPNPIITSRYVYLPGGTPDPNAPVLQDCTMNPEFCSPPDLCNYWGEC